MRYYILIFVIILIASCGRKVKAPLNREEFTNLLIDVHFIDGILGVEGYSKARGSLEYQKYYNSIFNKYGITSADFDSCIVIYSQNLIEYEKIYQVVVDSLNQFKSGYDLELQEKLKRDTSNLWSCEKSYSFPSDSANIVECDVPFNESGMYSLSLRVKFKEGDKGVNNRITGFFVKKNRVGYDTIIPFDTIKLRADTVWRYYSMHKFADDTTYIRLHFKILDCDNVDSIINRNADIKSIKLVNPMFEGHMRRIEDFQRR